MKNSVTPDSDSSYEESCTDDEVPAFATLHRGCIDLYTP